MIKYWNILNFCFVFTTSSMVSPPPPPHTPLSHRDRKLWLELLVKSRVHVFVVCFVVIKQRCCSRLLHCRADSQLSCENDGQHEDEQFDNTDCHKNKMHKKHTKINYKFVTLLIHYYILLSDMESFSEVWIGKSS